MDGTVAESRQTAATVAANADTKATSVKLIIKSSNQQYDDQTIESDMMWTIKRLKMHLQNTHPSKPPLTEQKLIYSGQLLNDKLLLKDVLRSYKDVYTQNHIIHLVYTPKVDTVKPTIKTQPQTAPTPTNSSNMTTATTTAASEANSTSTSTLRQRPVVAQQQQTQTQQQQQQFGNFGTQFMPQVGTAACPPFYGQNFMPFNFQLMATQQNVMQQWMQQVYSQYMDQYARFSSANGVNDNNATAATTTPTEASAGMPWPTNAFMPYMSFNPGSMPYPVIPPPTFLTATPTNVVGTPNNEQTTTPQTGTPEVAENAENERDQAAAPAEPRFPLLAVEEVDNRDWLDSFFAITRLAIFLTIMYFNSSPMRCLAVVLIASFIYLYHNGVLRFNRERNNNNINRNNNAEVAPAAAAAAAPSAEAAQPEDDSSSNDDDSEETDTADESNESANPTATPASTAQSVITSASNENSSSFMSTVQTFVITFFTSLLPETPAVN